MRDSIFFILTLFTLGTGKQGHISSGSALFAKVENSSGPEIYHFIEILINLRSGPWLDILCESILKIHLKFQYVFYCLIYYENRNKNDT